MWRWILTAMMLLFSPSVQAAADALGDELPQNAVLRLGTARLMHREAVHGLAFSADGQRLASAGWDGAVVLWQVPSGRELSRLRIQERTPEAVSFSAEGKCLITQIYSDQWVLRDAETGKEQRRGREDCPLNTLAFSPDGALFAGGCGDGSIRVRETRNGKLRATLRGHTKEVRALTFQNANTLVSGSADDTIRFWDVSGSAENGEELHRISAVHGQGVGALAFSPDGKLLASGGGMETDVRIFDAAEKKPLFEVEVSYLAIAALAFSPDGKLLAAGGWDNRVKLIDVARRVPLRLSAGHEDALASLVYSTDGRRIYSGGKDDRIIAWDAATGERLVERALPSRVSALAARENGELAITLGGMWKTLLVDGKTLLDRRQLEGGEFAATSRRELLAIADSARVLLFAGHASLAPQKTGMLEAWSVALSPDGKQLAVGGAPNLHRGGTELWELPARRLLTKLAGHEDHVAALHYTPDGNTLITASYHQVRVWNLQRATLVRAFDFPDQQIRDLALSPDGQNVAVGLGNGTVRLWRWQSSAASRTFSGHVGGVNAVAFSPDGKQVASASQDGSVLIFNTR